MTNHRLSFAVVLGLLISLALGTTVVYQKSINYLTFKSSFPISTAYLNDQIVVYVKPINSAASYNVVLWRPFQQAPTNSPF